MPRPSPAHRSEVPLGTLGKLADREYRLFGSCLSCASRYDPKLGPRNPPSMFDIDLAALIGERGRDCQIVGMPPVVCPYCGSRRTEIRLLPPPGSPIGHPSTAPRGDVARSAKDGRGA